MQSIPLFKMEGAGVAVRDLCIAIAYSVRECDAGSFSRSFITVIYPGTRSGVGVFVVYSQFPKIDLNRLNSFFRCASGYCT